MLYADNCNTYAPILSTFPRLQQTTSLVLKRLPNQALHPITGAELRFLAKRASILIPSSYKTGTQPTLDKKRHQLAFKRSVSLTRMQRWWRATTPNGGTLGRCRKTLTCAWSTFQFDEILQHQIHAPLPAPAFCIGLSIYLSLTPFPLVVLLLNKQRVDLMSGLCVFFFINVTVRTLYFFVNALYVSLSISPHCTYAPYTPGTTFASV